MAFVVNDLPPCVLFEDEHLLVINKPPGLNTHSPAPYAGEGIYDWLRHREPRWNALAIIHRLDKETSGVIVFAKTPTANRSLTQQFTERSVQKTYLLLTDQVPDQQCFNVKSRLARLANRYVSRPPPAGVEAETRFRVLGTYPGGGTLVQAEPLTGRTHQIRVHAAERGFPVKGDVLYGGAPAQRLYLHSAKLGLNHPISHQRLTWNAKADFDLNPSAALRDALLNSNATDCYRLIHGAGDHYPGNYLDRLGEFLLLASADNLSVDAQSSSPAVAGKPIRLEQWITRCHGARGIYIKSLSRQPAESGGNRTSPRHFLGEEALESVLVRENGVRFILSFREGCSVGLFLDQRDNRRRLLSHHVAAHFPLFPPGHDVPQVLNTFAYTCAFSVCAAKGGAHTTSLDLSRKYLDWGRRNFESNNLDPAAHDFIYGDAFHWMGRLAKKKRAFDLIILDPPTFSRSREHGTFQVENDYPALVTLALSLLKPNSVLLASTNLATLRPEAFLKMLTDPIHAARRRVIQQFYAPQPPDFPISRDEPAYLKTFWLRVG